MSGTASATINVTVTTDQVASLTIVAPSSLLVGQMAQANVIARDNSGKQLALIGKPAWSSSDDALMTVDQDGIITTRGSGAVTLRVAAEGREATLAVTLTRGVPAVKFTAIATGLEHTCGIAGGGAVPQGNIACWGKIAGSRLAPSWMITGGRTFKTIGSGLFHSCAIAHNGETLCWGNNAEGQLGDGTTSTRADPTRVTTSENFVGVALGESFTCGLNADGITYCWGLLASRSAATPTRLANAPKFRQIVAERYMLCGLTDSGEVHCIGSGQQVSYSTLTRITSPVSFNAIASSDYHTCGLSSTGAAYCWGLNSSGQIGASTILVSAPALLPGGLSFTSIHPGGSSTCGITMSGARCIGSAGFGGSNVPGASYLIPGQYHPPLTTISNRGSHGCAIDNDGIAWCWGLNVEGQVGTPYSLNVLEPVMIIADPLT